MYMYIFRMALLFWFCKKPYNTQVAVGAMSRPQNATYIGRIRRSLRLNRRLLLSAELEIRRLQDELDQLHEDVMQLHCVNDLIQQTDTICIRRHVRFTRSSFGATTDHWNDEEWNTFVMWASDILDEDDDMHTRRNP